MRKPSLRLLQVLLLPGLLWACPPSQADAQERVAPAPGCLDARRMQEARQADPRTLAVMQDDGVPFRLDLGEACPGVVVDGGAELLAREGWVCPGGPAFVATADRRCAVAAVHRIDRAGYAGLARASHRDASGTTTLDVVTVQAEARRGFAGSSWYCVNPRWMRGWSEDADGVVLEVSPRRSGGHRYYRLELARTCPELADAVEVQLHSGPRIGLICGNAGDRLEVLPDTRPSIVRSPLPESRVARIHCPISAVYPIAPADG